MQFKARVSEEVALELMRAEWPNSGLFVEIKAIEDTGRIKMELTKGNKTPTRTKVEHVKVDPSEALLLVLGGSNNVFWLKDGEYIQMNGSSSAAEFLLAYRCIETPITEREEFVEKVGNILPTFDKRTNPMLAGKLYDADCRFVGA